MVASSSRNDGVGRSSGMFPSEEICDINFTVYSVFLSCTVRVHGAKQCENSILQRTVQTRALASASGVDNVEASSGEYVGFKDNTRY